MIYDPLLYLIAYPVLFAKMVVLAKLKIFELLGTLLCGRFFKAHLHAFFLRKPLVYTYVLSFINTTYITFKLFLLRGAAYIDYQLDIRQKCRYIPAWDVELIALKNTNDG